MRCLLACCVLAAALLLIIVAEITRSADANLYDCMEALVNSQVYGVCIVQGALRLSSFFFRLCMQL